MNKCSYCGTEFDGKFCSECGKKWESEKTCPKCGAVCQPTAKFCNECGHSFVEDKTASVEQSRRETAVVSSGVKSKIVTVLRFMPYILFGLYAVLLFAFCAAPMAVMPANLFSLQAESMGNAYKDFMANAEEMKAHVIAMWVIVGLTALLALITCLPKLSSYRRQVLLLRELKYDIKVLVFFEIAYLANLIISSIIMSEIVKIGEGLIVAGACPKLILSFAVIFGVFTVAAMVAAVYLPKLFPDKQQTVEKTVAADNRAKEEQERRNRYYETHEEPKCISTDKKSLARYKLAKKRYDKCKEGAPSNVAVWATAYRTPLVVVAAILAAIVIVLCITIPMTANIFRVGKVKKIELGYKQAQVEKILGKPYEETKSDTRWEYYDNGYLKLAEKLQKNEAEQEKALTSGDLSKLNKLTTEYENLELKLLSTEYDYIEVRFEKDEENKEYLVSSVMLNKDCKDSLEEKPKKTLKEVNFSLNGEIGYIESSNGKNLLFSGDASGSPYCAEYSDGSFIKCYVSGSQVELNDKLAQIMWKDTLGEYSATVNPTKMGEIKNGIFKLTMTGEQKSSLKSITIPEGVTSIGDSAFYNCRNLTSVTISSSVTSIGDLAFYDCGNLTNITIPNSVTSIGNSAFSYCSSLTSIRMPNSVTSIGNSAFYGCSSLASVTIGEGVTSIGDSAFYNCRNLTSVTISSSVTNIGDYAFSGCSSLTNVTIPNSVTGIGSSAFYGCSSLTSITIPDSVTSIENNAFSSCRRLTNITIPASVTIIEDYALSSCSSLTSITIPDSVMSIGSYALSNCRSLTSITYEGTKAQWNAISKGFSWNTNTGNYTIHCTDGDMSKY